MAVDKENLSVTLWPLLLMCGWMGGQELLLLRRLYMMAGCFFVYLTFIAQMVYLYFVSPPSTTRDPPHLQAIYTKIPRRVD